MQASIVELIQRILAEVGQIARHSIVLAKLELREDLRGSLGNGFAAGIPTCVLGIGGGAGS